MALEPQNERRAPTKPTIGIRGKNSIGASLSKEGDDTIISCPCPPKYKTLSWSDNLYRSSLHSFHC
jgi:hypothetical protein